MTAMTAEDTKTDRLEIEVDGDEILDEFGRVMLEWGHYKTAAKLRYPALSEAAAAGRGRRTDRGSNKDPIPCGRPLFQPRQVRPVPPADCES